MNTEKLEQLKSTKRNARSNYTILRTIYIDKLHKGTLSEKKIYFEAIEALDEMQNLYHSLKYSMRKKSFSEQIKFAKTWNEFISCIESITAQKTNDKFLSRYINMDIELANKEAISLWTNYKTLSTQKYS